MEGGAVGERKGKVNLVVKEEGSEGPSHRFAGLYLKTISLVISAPITASNGKLA